MKKLSKGLIAERDVLSSRAQDTYEELEKAVEAYNTAVSAAWQKVQEAIDGHNEVVSDANSWMEGAASEIEDYTSEKSEKWQEGEKAQAYAEWKSQFEDEQFEQVEWSEPDPLEMGDIDLLNEKLDQLPTEFEG